MNEHSHPLISVKGGFLRSLEKHVAVIRALGFETRITFFQPLSSESPWKGPLTLLIENIRGKEVEVQFSNGDIDKLIRSHTSLMFEVRDPASQRIRVSYPQKSDEFDFFLCGDVHGVFEHLEQIIETANEEQPLFLMSNGDMTHSGRLHDYHALSDLLGKARIPVFTSLGNHDKRARGGRKTYRRMLAPFYYAFDVQNVRCIVLDSSRKRGLPRFQYRWLERELQLAQGRRIFVMLHRPPICPKYNYLSFSVTANAKRFLSLMEAYQVEMVFASHVHVLAEFQKGNVRYVVTGGGGGALWQPSNIHHYLHVFVKQDGVEIQVRELPTPEANISQRLKDAIRFNVEHHITNNRRLKQAIHTGNKFIAARSASSKRLFFRRRKK